MNSKVGEKPVSKSIDNSGFNRSLLVDWFIDVVDWFIEIYTHIFVLGSRVSQEPFK